MSLKSNTGFKKEKSAQSRSKESARLGEAAKRLREEEHELSSRLAAIESFGVEKIIDDWQERSSPYYEEALRHRLRQIRDALLRLSLETYGCCTECGTKINSNRLSNDPTISLCLNCQAAEGERL